MLIKSKNKNSDMSCYFNRVFVILLISFFTTPIANAGNSTTIANLILRPTFNNIGVTCEFSGDDNANMKATIQYRKCTDGTCDTEKWQMHIHRT